MALQNTACALCFPLLAAIDIIFLEQRILLKSAVLITARKIIIWNTVNYIVPTVVSHMTMFLECSITY